MAFDIAISGMRAASDDLSVIGNNISNASTVGFKNSRAEFADVYAATGAGQSGNAIGSGVLRTNVAQEFKQGSVTFTDNSLDMAVNGQGFFTLSDGGSISYTRAGYFNVDKNGVLVNNKNKHLQGFVVDDTGRASSQLSDINIKTDNINPRPTKGVSATINFAANATPPEVRGSTTTTTGAQIGVARAGANNGYSAETLTLTDGTGGTQALTTTANDSAAAIATSINTLNGVAATASTTGTLSGVTDSGTLQVRLNGVLLQTSTGAGTVTANSLAIAINNQTSSNLQGISATVSGGVVTVTSNTGEDLKFSITGGAGDGMSVAGPVGAGVALTGTGTTSSTVGGTVNLTLDQNYTLTSSGAGAALFPATISQNPFVQNSFDPTNPKTYNDSTNVTIYDSQGLSHDMRMYYVKQSGGNNWKVYVQVDNKDVGDPNVAAAPPLNTQPTQASYNLSFNADGTLNQGQSTPIQITNWNPVDPNGNPTKAYGGLTVANGATFPVTYADTNSNFVVDMTGSTQFGDAFSKNSLNQNGYATGRLTSLDISGDGSIFAHYTNGQSKVLAKVALTNFSNTQGLRPNGDTSWVETFASGVPNVGSAGSSSFGSIQGGALEQSNVDLSGELVNLIVAQRDFQANAKTIQTEDAVTQAIINLR